MKPLNNIDNAEKRQVLHKNRVVIDGRKIKKCNINVNECHHNVKKCSRYLDKAHNIDTPKIHGFFPLDI